MDTLAAAYAEAGQFGQAVKTAERAVELALKAGLRDLAEGIRGRMELYKAKRAFREVSVSKNIKGTEAKKE